MKKILGLISLFCAFNVLAQPIPPLNLPAVLSGNTGDIVCVAAAFPGDPEKINTISCGNRSGITSALKVNMDMLRMISEFVGSGKWELTTTMVGKSNNSAYIITRK